MNKNEDVEMEVEHGRGWHWWSCVEKNLRIFCFLSIEMCCFICINI